MELGWKCGALIGQLLEMDLYFVTMEGLGTLGTWFIAAGTRLSEFDKILEDKKFYKKKEQRNNKEKIKKNMDWIVPESFLLRMKSNSVGVSQCLKNQQVLFFIINKNFLFAGNIRKWPKKMERTL